VRSPKALTFAAVLASSAAIATTMYVRTEAQVVTPPPQELRFQALLTQPIATPDRRSVVAGTSVLLVRDRLTGQCFVAVTIGNSMGLSPAPCEQ
jgi:hypothetical protein